MGFTAEDFAKVTDVSRETFEKLALYGATLEKWQAAKNLVAGTTIADMWQRHFYDSAQLAPLIREHSAFTSPTMADIGAGAGFPGLVLALMGVGHVRLIEANGRKCSFLRQVIQQTGSEMALVDNRRVEAIEDVSVDIIVSRACASVSQLLMWGLPLLGEKGEFWLLKGEKLEEELTEAARSWKMDIKRFPSQTDAGGAVVRLQNIAAL